MQEPAEQTQERRRQEDLWRELSRILEILVRDVDPQAVLVFGSMASGDVREFSDIDLLVVRETDKRWFDRIKEVLLLVRPRLALDIMVLTPKEWEQRKGEDPFFREEVLRRGRVLYGKA